MTIGTENLVSLFERAMKNRLARKGYEIFLPLHRDPRVNKDSEVAEFHFWKRMKDGRTVGVVNTKSAESLQKLFKFGYISDDLLRAELDGIAAAIEAEVASFVEKSDAK